MYDTVPIKPNRQIATTSFNIVSLFEFVLEETFKIKCLQGLSTFKFDTFF